MEKMNISEFEKPIEIDGTCSVASRKQAIENAVEAHQRGIRIVRACGYKPRTEPGEDIEGFFDGIYRTNRNEYLSALVEICNLDIIPALEVSGPQMAKDVLDTLEQAARKPKVLLWLGSRNQKHTDQTEVAKLVVEKNWAMLMIKNPMWRGERHWRGAIDFVTRMGGLPIDRLIVCHRGFDPGTDEPRDPKALRNNPDYEMAMRIKNDLGVTMIVDASHIGGSRENVLRIAKEAMVYEEDGIRFDGLMLETCQDPSIVKTDAKQHLTWEDRDVLMTEIKNNYYSRLAVAVA